MVQIARNDMQEFGAPIKKAEPEVVPLNTMFEAYCRMDPLSDARKENLLPLSQLNVWLSSARILDMSRVTTTDTGLSFFKFRKRAISYEELLVFVKDLTSTKGLDLEDTKKKMQTCPIPVHPRDFKVKTDKK